MLSEEDHVTCAGGFLSRGQALVESLQAESLLLLLLLSASPPRRLLCPSKVN